MVEDDLRFHRTIFLMAENRVCSLMFSIVHESLHKLMEITSQMVDLEHTLRLHQRIYNAIKKGDPGEARARMFAHLTDAKELLTKSNAARIQTQLGDRLSTLSLARTPKQRPARRRTGLAGGAARHRTRAINRLLSHMESRRGTGCATALDHREPDRIPLEPLYAVHDFNGVSHA